MIFLAPLALCGLLTLPLVWWLLRATPPRPRQMRFPPLQILRTLRPTENDAAKSPLWLLILRLLAVSLLILGLSQPVITGTPLPVSGNGAIALVIDNGMLTAPDWSKRLRTALNIVDNAALTRRQVSLILTATSNTADTATSPFTPRPAETVRRTLTQLRPVPWGVRRAEIAKLSKIHPPGHFGTVIYLSDGVASEGDAAFAQALQTMGPVREIRFPDAPVYVLKPATGAHNTAIAQLVTLPAPHPRQITVRLHTQEGGTLATIPLTLPARATQADISASLPSAVMNRIDRITLNGLPGAASAFLLDEGDRMHPVGLITSGASDTRLTGPLFYLRRALSPTAELHEGTGASLLQQSLSVIIAPDGTLSDPAVRHTMAKWIEQGGTLIRFAGPTLAGHNQENAQNTEAARTADAATDLLPVPLLSGARQLGGTMTWGTPQKLAAFDTTSPFHGLQVPADVTVSRQILASPVADLSSHNWARLQDGTPLVTYTTLGKGTIILFHVSSTADWSSLPLSGLFVSMLQRLIDQANGVSAPADNSLLAPVLTLDGDGVPGLPPPEARSLRADAFTSTPVSEQHPPGLYGPKSMRLALNAGTALPALKAEKPAGPLLDPSGHRSDTHLAGFCLAGALILLCLDTMLTLLLRSGFPGTKRSVKSGASLLACFIMLSPSARAQEAMQNTPPAALETRLAYIITGHKEVDDVSRQGLQGLSDYTNARTSARLGSPDGVIPGKSDLSYYPMIYWPVTADAQVTPAQTAALTSFMAHGGILFIDTQGQDMNDQSAGSSSENFAGDAPGTAAALRRVTNGLPIPPLTEMTDHHLLAHTFYLLHEFPGRYAGQPVWVTREGEAENDDVSPVIIGSADWAHAWAVDDTGNSPYAVIPQGAAQRKTAYRFGVNAVIYALTGNYKADQLHVPALLKRLGGE